MQFAERPNARAEFLLLLLFSGCLGSKAPSTHVLPRAMGSRTVRRVVRKKPSSHKAAAPKRRVRSKRATSAAKRRQGDKAVLKRPSRVASLAPSTSDWLEFTPKTIDQQRCLARTWDDGYGGKCARTPLNDNCKLCSVHKAESERHLP